LGVTSWTGGNVPASRVVPTPASKAGTTVVEGEFDGALSRITGKLDDPKRGVTIGSIFTTKNRTDARSRGKRTGRPKNRRWHGKHVEKKTLFA